MILFKFLSRACLVVIVLCFLACTSQRIFSAKGVVSNIQRGKDGYTAVLKDQYNKQYYAVISRVNLANTTEYQQLQIGDNVTVYGDTVRLGDIISIKVSKIKK